MQRVTFLTVNVIAAGAECGTNTDPNTEQMTRNPDWNE